MHPTGQDMSVYLLLRRGLLRVPIGVIIGVERRPDNIGHLHPRYGLMRDRRGTIDTLLQQRQRLGLSISTKSNSTQVQREKSTHCISPIHDGRQWHVFIGEI